MNTNDLRFIKTEKFLKDAFISLKMKKQPFTLTQLCQEAMINKTTFYKHYETLEEFEYKTCKEIIKKLYLECEHIHDAFSNTEMFVIDLRNKVSENIQLIDALFYQDPYKNIVLSEDILLELYLKDSYSLENELKIRFAIAGSSKIMMSNPSSDTSKIIIDLLKKVMK